MPPLSPQIKNLRGGYILAEIKPVELGQVMLLKKMRKNILSINHAWLMVLGAFAPVMSAFGQTSEDTLSVNDFQIQEVVVSAPVRQSIVSREEVKYQELNHDNTGQNLPILLSKTPSLVSA